MNKGSFTLSLTCLVFTNASQNTFRLEKMKAKHSLNIIVLALTLLISACAVKNDHTLFHGLGLTYHSKIETLPDGSHIAAVEAAPAAGRKNGAIAYATKNAYEYCKYNKGKSLKVLSTEIDTNFIVNGVARLKFECN